MQQLTVTIDGQRFQVNIDLDGQSGPEYVVQVDGQSVRVRIPDTADGIDQLDWMAVDDHPYRVCLDENVRWIQVYPWIFHLEIRNREAPAAISSNGKGPLCAPIPGQIQQVLVTQGQQVKTGDPLMILEAMKMENEILAPHPGTVVQLPVKSGDKVRRGDLLAEIN